MQQNLIDAARATDELITALEAAAVLPGVQMMQVYRAQLKTRAQMKRDIPEGQRGWWYDVAHGETLNLRQATQADIDRCTLNHDCSRSPSDYMCETFDRGSLVSKAAIAHITPEQHTFAVVGANQHPDDLAVDRFALAMKAKLADARSKGRSGWDDLAQCSVEYLAQLLVGHIGKDNAGNFEDVANLAMMLHQRGADPSVLAEAAGARPVESTAPISTQWWLAELDQYGSPKLVDGDHADMAGANRALYLINALGLGAGRKYAAAKVQLFEAVPDGRGAMLTSKERQHD